MVVPCQLERGACRPAYADEQCPRGQRSLAYVDRIGYLLPQALEGTFPWQNFFDTAAVQAQGADGKAGKTHRFAVFKRDDLRAGAADIQKRTAGQVQLLHCARVAEQRFVLAGNNFDRIAGGRADDG